MRHTDDGDPMSVQSRETVRYTVLAAIPMKTTPPSSTHLYSTRRSQRDAACPQSFRASPPHEPCHRTPLRQRVSPRSFLNRSGPIHSSAEEGTPQEVEAHAGAVGHLKCVHGLKTGRKPIAIRDDATENRAPCRQHRGRFVLFPSLARSCESK